MPDFTFTLTITCETLEQAQQVTQERLAHDEDYGFDYMLGYEPTDEHEGDEAMNDLETSTEYNEVRAAYWDAQSQFRQAAIDEMFRLAPAEVDTIVLELNDTPRLSLHTFLDANDADLSDETEVWDLVDSIASDMEVGDWDEADSFLLRGESPDQFIITRPTEEQQ